VSACLWSGIENTGKCVIEKLSTKVIVGVQEG
jgi:hypothetical protein